jgi:hypothetical protein
MVELQRVESLAFENWKTYTAMGEVSRLERNIAFRNLTANGITQSYETIRTSIYVPGGRQGIASSGYV